MYTFRVLIIFFGIGLTFISCADDNDPTMSDMMDDMGDDNMDEDPLPALVFNDVSYGDHPQESYDIYLPEGRSLEKTKVIILVHGGGWIEGDKADMSEFVTLIQTTLPDHAIINMNYVLATTTTTAFPDQFLDIDAVINKVTDEKESLQILPEFGLIGASAGAHISLMYDSVYDDDNQVKMVGDIVGPTNFKDPFYAENPNFEFLLSLLVDESQYPNTTDYAEATSPVFQASSSNSPTIMFYGDQDPLVPLANGQDMAQVLTNSSVTNNFTIYEGGHGDNWSDSDKLDLEIQLRTFVNTHLEIEEN